MICKPIQACQMYNITPSTDLGRRRYIVEPFGVTIKGTNEKSMNGVLTVMVREAKKLTTNLLIAQIALSIICIPLSIIHSFSFAFILLDPKSGETEKGMTVPPQVYHKNNELQAICMSKDILV